LFRIFAPHSAQIPSPTSFSSIFWFLVTAYLMPKKIAVPLAMAKIGAINGAKPITKRTEPANRIKSRFTNFNKLNQNGFDKKICRSSECKIVFTSSCFNTLTLLHRSAITIIFN